jgi:hypothetical protein
MTIRLSGFCRTFRTLPFAAQRKRNENTRIEPAEKDVAFADAEPSLNDRIAAVAIWVPTA